MVFIMFTRILEFQKSISQLNKLHFLDNDTFFLHLELVNDI